jgi:hypothetical protein
MQSNSQTEKQETELFPRRLKNVEISQIEAAIANALSELADSEYEVDIKQLNFEPQGGGFLNDGMEFNMFVKRKMTTVF